MDNAYPHFSWLPHWNRSNHVTAKKPWMLLACLIQNHYIRRNMSLTILISCLSFRAVVGLPQPPPLCLSYAVKVCWRILATHPTFLPQLSDNSPQPTILQYTPVSALANYVAWLSLRMIKNTKWFIKKHMPNDTFTLLGWLPLQAVPTLYCREWAAFTIHFVR